MYAATAPMWRDVVLGYDRASLKDLILARGRDVLECCWGLPDVRFGFPSEMFNLAEPNYVFDATDHR